MTTISNDLKASGVAEVIVVLDPNKGLAAVQEYDRERAHVRALQRTMVEKKCIAVALDSELAEVDAEMARIRSN